MELASDPARLFGCKERTIPFKYLGLLVGSNPRKLEFWKPIIDKVRSKLSLWKKKTLSFGGRLVLINLVLTSLPLFFMSLFKALKGVILKIDQLRRSFLWGKKKMAKIRWARVYLSKITGGLGVQNLE
ncbi:hypothetical protein REPUB_Repub17cG0069200 [Reevesia pubescens]